MYTIEQRVTAINLYIKYDKRIAPVIRELGYPSRKALRKWYRDFVENDGAIISRKTISKKYSKQERNTAVEYYLEHGKNISHTVRVLGYPCRTVLSRWIEEDVSNHTISCLRGISLVTYTQEEKENSVIDLSTRSGPVINVNYKLPKSVHLIFPTFIHTYI